MIRDLLTIARADFAADLADGLRESRRAVLSAIVCCAAVIVWTLALVACGVGQ